MKRLRAIAHLMALSLDDLFTSPDHYLHSFEGDAALFMLMDRAAYHRSIFLDARISAAGGTMRVPVAAFPEQVRQPAPIGWIFHIAHCGSTLLARALDQPTTNLVLREPLALRQLALTPDPQKLALTAAMLSKRYRADLPTIVKANVPVNFLLPNLVGLDPQVHAIFLHYGLRDYLLAILRTEDHRAWLRRVTTQLAGHLGDLSPLPDAERAAALWLAQMRAFAMAIAALPHARSLDAETFFAAPRRILGLAAAQLEVPITDAEIEAQVAGPLFATSSKNPELAFNNDARLARRSALERSLAGELDQAQNWIDRASEAAPALAAVAAAGLEA